LQGPKSIGLKSLLYHWKDLGMYMFKMGSYDPFGHFKHKLWLKEMSKIASISLRVGGMPHTIGKLSTRATTLL